MRGGALGADRVHHGAHVVHPLLEGRNVDDPVREPGSALVEGDKTGERGQALTEPDNARLERPELPVLEMRVATGHEHDAESTFAGHLVRNADVTALSVARQFAHGATSDLPVPALRKVNGA